MQSAVLLGRLFSWACRLGRGPEWGAFVKNAGDEHDRQCTVECSARWTSSAMDGIGWRALTSMWMREPQNLFPQNRPPGCGLFKISVPATAGVRRGGGKSVGDRVRGCGRACGGLRRRGLFPKRTSDRDRAGHVLSYRRVTERYKSKLVGCDWVGRDAGFLASDLCLAGRRLERVWPCQR